MSGRLWGRIGDTLPSWRVIRAVVDAVLTDLSVQFDLLYLHIGRPSIAPEKWRRALLLQVLYTVRSERRVTPHVAQTPGGLAPLMGAPRTIWAMR